jgi:fructose-1,6-bisphosphatase/inositol monophosphatase family enzyme
MVMTQAAERAIMPRYRKLEAGQIREKQPEELVTVADEESEAILASGLARILPEAHVLGEEAASADEAVMKSLSSRLCWIIDPLDGTSNFARGDGPFGILVALAEHGETVGAWLYDPRKKRFCTAMKGEGACIDGERIRAVSSGESMPIAGLSSLLEKSADRVALVQRIGGAFTTTSIPRCAAEQYPRIVQGFNDVTLFERTLPWDHAAGALFLEESGGIVTRFDGSPYRLGDQRDGLVAAGTGWAWERAIEQTRLFA